MGQTIFYNKFLQFERARFKSSYLNLFVESYVKVRDTNEYSFSRPKLPIFPTNSSLTLASKSLYGKKSIYLTVCNSKESSKTFLLDLLTTGWPKQSLPDLNFAWDLHSNCCVNDQVFVTCGLDVNHN